jgi:hypothetical protein
MKINLSSPHTWNAEVLERRPLVLPARQFTYPAQVDEVERGALEILIQPSAGEKFLATFALGFADPAAATGLWSCPHRDWLCAVSGGYAYLLDTTDPRRWSQIEYRPVLEVRTLVAQELLLFAGHHSLLAWGRDGQAWQTRRLSWEGVRIDDVDGDILTGSGWDLMTDSDVPFRVDLRTGLPVTGIGSGE